MSGQCPEFYGGIPFFETKVENVKNGGLKIKNVLNSTLWVNKQFSEPFQTLTAKSKLKFGSPSISMRNM